MISQIRQHNHILSFIGNISEEAKLVMTDDMLYYWNSAVGEEGREANSAAHTLAKEALSLDEDFIYG